jgi:hypothetical protein
VGGDTGKYIKLECERKRENTIWASEINGLWVAGTTLETEGKLKKGKHAD